MSNYNSRPRPTGRTSDADRGVRDRLRRAAISACVGVLLPVISASCGRVPDRQWDRGDFHPAPGRSWDLPTGLEVNTLVGWEDDIPGSLLPLALTLANQSGDRRSVTMPAGLCFKPRDPDYQWMILLQDFTFTVPVNDTIILLPTFCANEERDEPEEDSFYDIDLQAWDSDMKELYDLLKGKVVDETLVDLDMLQDALWELTDGTGLTDSTRAWLQSLP